MSFNVTTTITPASGLTATAGVESVVLKWTPPADFGSNSVYEVWGHTANTFGSATKLQDTADNKFSHGGLAATVIRYYWVRVATTLASGDVKYSTTITASATPLRATLGTGQVLTTNVASNAITTRNTYTETGSEYVRIGTDSNGGTTSAGDEVWTLPDIPFVGDGNTQVITTICRQSETPVYFRVGNSTVWAKVRASIIDVTGGGTVLDAQELTVAGVRVEQQGMSGGPWLTFPHHRDFTHNFILSTTSGRNYAVRFRLECGCDDFNNYILWASDYRQVLWQIYKR